MSTTSENIILNSGSYTPVYLIQNPTLTQLQTGSYVITNGVQAEEKPTSNNLKIFYENSGNLENSPFLDNANIKTKPSVQRQDNAGQDNTKLSTFLIPKSNIPQEQYVLANNIVLNPITSANKTVPINFNTAQKTKNSLHSGTMQKLNMDRKIIKLDRKVNIIRNNSGKIQPKIKPKGNFLDPPKPTQVQIIKMGNTYHCLNNLNDYEKKIVDQALKKIKDPDKIPPEPMYDPVTNTHFIYKIVSPSDLVVVGEKKSCKDQKVITKVDIKKKVTRKCLDSSSESENELDKLREPKLTRCGRKIKVPRHMIPEEFVQKPRKYGNVRCIKCSAEFSNIYRLNHHYESHINTNTHTNLFHCLLGIIEGTCDDEKAKVFIQQLEHLLEHLKSLLPCMLKKMNGISENMCAVGAQVASLFGISSGEHNFNMEALGCVKDKDGYCKHNPQRNKQFNLDISKPSQHWLSKHNEEIANVKVEMDECKRGNPFTEKNLKVNKHKIKQVHIVKKMKLNNETSKSTNQEIENVSEDINESAINVTKDKSLSTLDGESKMVEISKNKVIVNNQVIGNENRLIKVPTVKFHSAHFDIRSSPIKPSSTTFRKFQIISDRIPTKYVQIIKPLTLDQEIGDKEKKIQIEAIKPSQVQEAVDDNYVNVPIHIPNTTKDIIDNMNDWPMLTTFNDEVHDNNVKINNLRAVTVTSADDNPTNNFINNDANNLENFVASEYPGGSSAGSGQSISNILDTFFNDYLTCNEFC